MSKDQKPDIVYVRASQASIVTFHSDGTITLDDRFKEQPDEAARLFLEYIYARWLTLTRPDGWIGKPSSDAGPTVVVDNDADRVGWERVGHVFRPFKYTDG